MTIDGRKARPVSRKRNLVVVRPPTLESQKRRKSAASEGCDEPTNNEQGGRSRRSGGGRGAKRGEERVIDGPEPGQKPSRRLSKTSPDEWPTKPDSLDGQVDCLVGLLATGRFGRGDCPSLADAWGMSPQACRRIVLQAQLTVRRAIPDESILELCTGSLIETVDAGGAVGVRAAQVLLASRGLLKQVVDQTTHHDLTSATADQLRDRLDRAMARARESEPGVVHSSSHFSCQERTNSLAAVSAPELAAGAPPRWDSGDDSAPQVAVVWARGDQRITVPTVQLAQPPVPVAEVTPDTRDDTIVVDASHRTDP